MNNHYNLIEKTINLAIQKMKEGFGGPFAAIIVKNGEIIGTGFNSVTSTNDPTAHAEIVAIRNACNNLGTFQLGGCILYSSCEPCPMCLGAIYWARLDSLYYASTRFDAAKAGFDDEFIYEEFKKPLENRKISTIQINHPDHFLPFKEWIELEQKTEY